MFYKRLWLAFVTLTILVLLSGCLSSEEDTLEETNSIVKEEFLSDLEIERNFESNDFEMYKPDSLEFSEARGSNLIFFEGEQPYILFVNELEAPNSKWFYDDLKEREEELHLRTFETEDRFAYYSVEEKEEEHYEVQVGIGGIKMATRTELNNLKEDVQEMIKMVKSIDTK